VSNNGDGSNILATVASTQYAFIKNHPNAYIFATGSTLLYGIIEQNSQPKLL